MFFKGGMEKRRSSGVRRSSSGSDARRSSWLKSIGLHAPARSSSPQHLRAGVIPDEQREDTNEEDILQPFPSGSASSNDVQSCHSTSSRSYQPPRGDCTENDDGDEPGGDEEEISRSFSGWDHEENVGENESNCDTTLPSLTFAQAKDRVEKISSWSGMLAYLALSGRTTLTAVQYNLFAAGIRGANAAVRLPSYKWVRNPLGAHLSNHCFASSRIVHIKDVQGMPRGKHIRVHSGEERNPAACVRVVFPSQWAKLDVLTWTFYNSVYENNDKLDILNVENSQMVQRRASMIGSKCSLWAKFRNAPCIAEDGDIVRFLIPGMRVQAPSVVRSGWSEAVLRQGISPRGVSFDGTVSGVWCVTSTDSPSPTPSCAYTWNPNERALFHRLSRATTSTFHRSAPGRVRDVMLYPGDVCVLLRPRVRASGNTLHCVLVASYVAQAIGGVAERLVWIDESDLNCGSAAVPVKHFAVVGDLPTWLSGRRSLPRGMDNDTQVRCTGTLENGERYVVYRIALYMDGFKQHKSQYDSKSVGGCYILPMGIPADQRKSTAATRVVTLAPHGQSHNEVFSCVLEDLANAAQRGVEGTDPYGRAVRIFVDPVTFLADYPAASAGADVRGHNANVFCTHCGMCRRSHGVCYMFSTSLHSRRLGLARFDNRMAAIRLMDTDGNNDDSFRKITGLKKVSVENANELPLVRLSREIRAGNCDGGRVHPLCFEPTLSCTVAPDHLITGLIKNTLHACFTHVGVDARRKLLERRIVSIADENGLPLGNHILRFDSRGVYGGLHSLTMSALMCALFCSAPVFDNEFARTSDAVFRLCTKLQDLVAHVYYIPPARADREDTNGHEAEIARFAYLGELVSRAEDYVNSSAAVARVDEDVGKILDKPNSHRLIELVMHTVPSFGHARACSEMVMELTHRVFKAWLEKNTHSNAHITAVERALSRDWLGRLHALYMCWMHGSEPEKDCAERGLLRLMVGEDASVLDLETSAAENFLLWFRKNIKDMFQEPVLSQMAGCSHLSPAKSKKTFWAPLSRDRHGTHRSAEAVREGKRILHVMLHFGRGRIEDFSRVVNAARFETVDTFTGNVTSYPHQKVTSGCAVAITVRDDAYRDVVQVQDRGCGGVDMFFAVHGVLAQGEDVYAVVGRLEESERRFKLRDTRVSVVLLDDRVQRVAAIHDCGDECIFPSNEPVPRHAQTLLNGGAYIIKGREEGYPPHMG